MTDATWACEEEEKVKSGGPRANCAWQLRTIRKPSVRSEMKRPSEWRPGNLPLDLKRNPSGSSGENTGGTS